VLFGRRLVADAHQHCGSPLLLRGVASRRFGHGIASWLSRRLPMLSPAEAVARALAPTRMGRLCGSSVNGLAAFVTQPWLTSGGRIGGLRSLPPWKNSSLLKVIM
jgi:hypothetical protein